MKPAPIQEFLRPATLAEATKALAETDCTTVAIAGGQSLVPMLALRVAPADRLVHLARLPELGRIERMANVTRIGAGVTHARIEDGAVGGPADAFLRTVAAGISYRSVRNHGTIGGSMALADPAADWPAALLALNAQINVAGPAGTRALSVGDFLRGAYTTALEPGEIIVSIDVPDPAPGTRFAYRKVARKSGAFAMSIGCAIRSTSGNRVVLGGTATRAELLSATSDLIATNPSPPEGDLRRAIATDLAAVAPDADAYQQRLHTATVLAAVKDTGR